MSTPTAYWPLPSLLRSLARAGWGELARPEDRALRGVLRGLSDVLDDRTAAGETTAPQLHDVTGYSEKWVRNALERLEALGIVEWHRGGIAGGKPTPSVVRVVKARLVELIHKARPDLVAKVRARAVETTKRLAALPPFISGRQHGPRGHKRRSDHAEVATTPHPQRGGIGGRKAAPAVPAGASVPDWKAAAAAAAAAAVPPPRLRVAGGAVVDADGDVVAKRGELVAK